jgi:hypothetical protein
LLAALQAFGPERGAAYAPLPKWRRTARRPSCLDLVALLRNEAAQNPALLSNLGFRLDSQQLLNAAAA